MGFRGEMKGLHLPAQGCHLVVGELATDIACLRLTLAVERCKNILMQKSESPRRPARIHCYNVYPHFIKKLLLLFLLFLQSVQVPLAYI